jgi:hypothetical protein
MRGGKTSVLSRRTQQPDPIYKGMFGDASVGKTHKAAVAPSASASAHRATPTPTPRAPLRAPSASALRALLRAPLPRPQSPKAASPRPQSPKASPLIEPSIEPYTIVNTLLKKKALVVPQQFKANTEFTYLSHSIYNGKKKDKKGVFITSYHPPSYITYNMLIREIGVFLEDEFYSEEELQEQYRKAKKTEKEALKIKLWKIWYNIIVGDDNEKDYTKKGFTTRTLSQIGKRSGKRKSIGGVGSYNTPPSSPLSEGFASPYNSQPTAAAAAATARPARPAQAATARPAAAAAARPSTTRPVAAVAAATAASPTPEEKVFHQFLFDTMTHYKDSADNTKRDSYGYTDQEYEIAYFKFAFANATEAISRAYDVKLELQKRLVANKVNVHDIVCGITSKGFPYPDPLGYNTIYRPNDKLYLYGMQLPHQFNRDLLLKSMIYLLHMKIYNIADLHGCGDGINRQNPRMNDGIGCNPYDRNCELLMWEKARLLTLTQPETKCTNIKATRTLPQAVIDDYQLKPDELKHLEKGIYYDIKIKDMTAGYFWSWNEISKIKDISRPENSIVVHCLAGAGRTASVMLYLMLRDTMNYLDATEQRGYETEIKTRLAAPHFGMNNIAEVIGMLSAYFVNYSSNIDAATGELFKIGSKILDRQTVAILKQNGVDDALITKILAQGLDTIARNTLIMDGVDMAVIREIEKKQVKSQASCSLLRQRLNRIFFFLAKRFKVNTFYTYGRPTKQALILPNDEFSNPVQRTISDWSNYDRDSASMDVVREWFK